MQLTERCDIWGWVGEFDGSKQIKMLYEQIECLRVPISEMDKVAAALSTAMTNSTPTEYFRSQARQATALFLVPTWVNVREDNELRYGRRLDLTGAVQQHRYTVSGIRTYGTFGYQDNQALFCQRLQSGN